MYNQITANNTAELVITGLFRLRPLSSTNAAPKMYNFGTAIWWVRKCYSPTKYQKTVSSKSLFAEKASNKSQVITDRLDAEIGTMLQIWKYWQ